MSEVCRRDGHDWQEVSVTLDQAVQRLIDSGLPEDIARGMSEREVFAALVLIDDAEEVCPRCSTRRTLCQDGTAVIRYPAGYVDTEP